MSFAVSEELLKPPVVTVSAGTDRLLSLVSNPSTLNYVYYYSAAGDEPQGVESPIFIVLTDNSGNESGELSGKSLKFDFIAPSVPAGKVFVIGSPAKKDGVVTMKFTVSEPLASDPVVSLSTASRLTPLALDVSSGLDYVYTYTATGNEPETSPSPPPVVAGARKRGGILLAQGAAYSAEAAASAAKAGSPGIGRPAGFPRAPEGRHTFPPTGSTERALEGAVGGMGVLVDLTDTAGNDASIALEKTIVFDFRPPALDGTPVVAPAVAKTGNTVTVAFTASEELKTLPIVMVGDAVLNGNALPGNNFEFGYKVNEGDADGEREIAITIEDRAGNVLADAAGGRFLIDSTVPQVTNVSMTSKKYSAVTGFNAVTLTFDSSEDVGAGLAVMIGGAPMSCGVWQATSPNCTCTYSVNGTEGEGTKEVSIGALDAAGNIGFGSASVEYDFTGPALVLSVQPNNRPARLGELVTVGVAASEALNPAGISLDSGTLALGTPTGSGTSYSWTYTVKDADNGIFNLSATATDVVGNPATTPATGTLTLDGVVPTVSNAVLSPARVAKGGQFTLTFDVSETPGADPAVAFNNGVDAPVPMSKTSSTGLSYTYTGTAPDAGSAPFYGVTVSVQDAAGNGTVASAGTVEIDNVAPQVAGLDITPKAAKKGDTVRVVLSATETLSGPPTLTASNGTETITLLPIDVTPGKINYSYEYPLTDSSPQGSFLVQGFSVSDVAGNERAVTPEAGWAFFVDSKEPVVGVAAADKARYSRVSGYEVVTVRFDCSEDVGTGIKATVGGAAMSCGAWQATSPNYACAYAVQAGDTGGVKAIEVKATDAAGNSGYGSGSVEFDFSAPWMISAKPGQAAYKLNDAILYTINASEPLSGSPARPVIHVYKSGVEQPAFFGAPVQETDTSFTYAKTAASGMDGAFTVRVDLTDKAGNAVADLSGDGFGVDATPPVVTEQTLTTNNPNSNVLAKHGETVTAVFTTNEDPPQNPSVSLGGKAMAFASKTGAGPYTFTYTRVAGAADGGGQKGVTVTTADMAGNVAVFSFTGTVTFDFMPPGVGTASVRFVPGATCPLASVTKVGIGNTAKIGFTVNEPLLTDPVISGLTGMWTVVKTAGSSPGLYYEFDLTLTAGTGEWSQTPKVVLTDAAGNAGAPVDLSGVTVPADATPPAAPDVNTADRIVYRRVPWGSDASAGVKTFQIVGGVNAVDADTAWVLAYDAPDPATATGIGRNTAGGGSFGTIDLERADRVEVFVVAYDSGCNRSPAVKVRDVEWTVTMGFKVAGSGFENPHSYEVRDWFGGDLVRTGAAEAGVGDGLDFVGHPPLLRSHGAGVWRKRVSVDPGKRSEHGAAYDAARGRGVLFGGYDGAKRLNDVFEWDGTNWNQKAPADPQGDGDPPPLSSHAMAYDNRRGRVVLFGGTTGVVSAQTWEWDGGSWAKKTPSDPEGDGNPAPRWEHALTFDGSRGKTVLFGGYDGGYKGDTWEWDGTSWANKVPSDPEGDGNPSARISHAMAYDLATSKTVMFGGDSGIRNDDTWEWDGTSWKKRLPTDPDGDGNPSARHGHTLFYDGSRRKVVLFGGCDAVVCANDETWEWDGASWAKTGPADPEHDGGPSGREKLALAYDSVRRRVVLFGGDTGVSNGETWEWDGMGWANKAPSDPEGDGNPSLREWHALAYDSARANVVLFGGYDGMSDGETWTWDGASWAKKLPLDPEGDGNPSPRHSHAIVFDSVRATTVLFGGSSGGGETWEWDGASWAKKTPADPEGDGNPAPRERHSLAFDVARGKTVLFGGCASDGCPSSETWEWDGTSWVSKEPSDPEGDGNPSARENHALVYDGDREKVLLFGGCAVNDCPTAEGWEWNGESWAKLAPSDPDGDGNPSAREKHAMACTDGKTVLFGGRAVGDVLSGETWELDGGTGSRPGQVVRVLLGATGVSAEAVVWRSADVTFYSGGVGYPTASEVFGVDLMAWDEGRWKVLVSNSSPPGVPTLLQWSITDAGAISRLLFGDQKQMSFAVAPTVASGTGTGEVSVDYAAVVVGYRIP
ncbi:MAG: hypothetical protein HY897_11965 [Deltaproteobacteria bacterium]|nr:hypothetical protein [Deltaproteobacteria bacterium]